MNDYDIVCYVADSSKMDVVCATRDSRELVKIKGKRAIIVTHVRDPVDAKRLRITADFVVYEITAKTTEKELRRIIDNKLCDMLLGVEQLHTNPGLHFQKILFNQVIATICAEQHIVVLLNLRPMIFESSGSVPLSVERIRFIYTLCEKYHTPYLGVTLAVKEIESRNPKDLLSVLQSVANPLHNLR